ncbi:MAG: N-formylglutamate amidohydrolase [Gemmatimonadaceae bacterium]|nr:N-formylglutamate amidohydrolase [Gemmatimonadaceae bacterium]
MRPALCLSVLFGTALSAGCGGSTAAPTPSGSPTFVVGQVATDANGWMEYTPGDAPLVIIAPHGGTQTPTELPDRTCSGCETVNDANTQDLARRLADAFYTRTGARPHLVVNRLSRKKFDANRDFPEASGGTATLAAPWAWFHAVIDSAEARIVKKTGRGLVIDLHGHAHDVARLEIGYLLNDPELRLSDAALTANGAMARTSIARLATDTKSAPDRGVALLRGANSLGALIVAAGYPAVPSPTDQAPLVGQLYFEGGYNTARHGSRDGGAVDAIQIECHYDNVRDSQTARTNFAWALSGALATYLDKHYGWKGPAS